MEKPNILVVAAHPDDEVLGVGGTLLKLAKENNENIHILFLSRGEASRGEKYANERLRENQARRTCQKLGATLHWTKNFPDNAFDSIPLLHVIQSIEPYLVKLQPHIVFTHYSQDLNIDHRITFQAVYTTFRPSRQRRLTKLYSFEVLSSTEWQVKDPSQVFLPNLYVDIAPYIKKKIELLNTYKREMDSFPFPRSAEGVLTLAQYRGMECGLKYAEAFKLIREIRR